MGILGKFLEMTRLTSWEGREPYMLRPYTWYIVILTVLLENPYKRVLSTCSQPSKQALTVLAFLPLSWWKYSLRLLGGGTLWPLCVLHYSCVSICIHETTAQCGREGSAGKGAGSQAWRPTFDPQAPCSRQTERILTLCALTTAHKAKHINIHKLVN